MVAQNTAWTPSSTGGESASATTPAPNGIKWAPDAPKKEAAPAKPKAAPAKEVTEDDAPEGMTAAEKKIWKIKVRGKEREFDASNEDELRKLVEKAFGADEVFQESAQTRKQAEQFFSMLKEASKDPRKLAQLLKHEQIGGEDFKKLAEQYLWEQIQEEKLTPEQKEQRRIKEELERYRQAEAEAKAKKEAEEQERVVGTIQETFTQSIQAAHKEVGLHTNPQSIYRMAEYARDAIERGEEPNFKTIAARVKQDYLEEFQHYFENADPEQLKAIASESFLKKLRKMDVERLKTTTPDAFKATLKRSAASAQRDPGQKKLDGADWRAKLIRERG